MSGVSQRDEDKRRRDSSLGDLAREIFGASSPRESQGSSKEGDTYDEVIKKIRDEYIKKIRREEKILWGVGIYF